MRTGHAGVPNRRASLSDEIEMMDGSKLSARSDHPRGSYENRLSRAQIEGKFRTYAKGVLSDAHVEDAIGAINRLEDLGSVRKLMDLLRTSQRAEKAA